jgi:ABC-type uncharacterized transport system auxiliary subunit
MQTKRNQLISLLFLLMCISTLSSCITTKQVSHFDNIPVLSQDELIRPYVKLGRIQVTRTMYASDYSLTPDIRAWGLSAVKQEGDKMGADAIMLYEVTGRTTTFGIIPSTEYIATGFAIKFK